MIFKSGNDNMIFKLILEITGLDFVVLLQASYVIFDFDVARSLHLHWLRDVIVIYLIRFNVINRLAFQEKITSLLSLVIQKPKLL